ncbi:MAG TPA: DinB family protein [Longimicrobiaceae bacterium]|nr:DinB family protein [Longimicrobiaceae bacterium]
MLLTGPRGEVVRGHLNHLIHHRGQLTVYLRLVDVPLPQVYGPMADEGG